jgi:hypothetical protein
MTPISHYDILKKIPRSIFGDRPEDPIFSGGEGSNSHFAD